MERCFTMLKPGVLNRRLVGQIINRLECRGLKIVGLKLMRISPELAAKHYAEHTEKPFFGELVSYITSAPVVAMVVEGDDVITLLRKTAGATKITEAAPGTIRGDFAFHTTQNVIHVSDSPEGARREISLFFTESELVQWEDDCGKWI